MSPRTQALFLSLFLIAGLGRWYSVRPGEFTIFSPGPTVNLLGTYDGQQILNVKGHKVYRDDGQLRLVTIRTSRPEDRVGLFRAVQGWVNPDVDVYPYDGIYRPDDTNDSTREQSVQQMTNSQDAATAAALTELGIDYETDVEVADVPAGPSQGKLRKGDVLLSIDGVRTTGSEKLVETIKAKKPGSQVEVVVRRGDRELSHTITTAPVGESGDEAKQSRIGVSIQQGFDFPLDVKVTLDEAIGGPSAGMMFALSIIDILTPGSMMDGKKGNGRMLAQQYLLKTRFITGSLTT
ncbi:MAG: PDZ domain-containing protein [Myxococcales bacterium]|nr:MAG: PDZ domain-containing protein [Myxococcales bacterium]